MGLAHAASIRSPIPVDRNLAVLLAVDQELRHNPGVTLAEAAMKFERRRQVFASTLGSLIDQTRYLSRRGILGAELQGRRDPEALVSRTPSAASIQLKGYELVDELRPAGERAAHRRRSRGAARGRPVSRRRVRPDPGQLATGAADPRIDRPPIELDRVLGSEANYAGMSFLTLDQLHHLRYGSEIVNVVCDARREHGPGLGTFAFDDEGVPAQGNDIIRDGQFVGYMTSRETAAAVGEARSNGCMRADGWARLPLIRMTNVSLQPGRAVARRGLRRGPRHLHGDQPELVDRRQALQLPVRLRDRLGDPQRQARAHAEESELQRHLHGVLECLRGHRGPRALDAVGRAQLRQGAARAGDGHGPRRQPRALPQDQDRERVCRMTACSTQVVDAARALGVTESRPSSPTETQALTRFANNAHPPERGRAERAAFGAGGDRRAHGARHHQPAGSLTASARWWRRRSRSRG